MLIKSQRITRITIIKWFQAQYLLATLDWTRSQTLWTRRARGRYILEILKPPKKSQPQLVDDGSGLAGVKVAEKYTARRGQVII